MNTKDKFQDIDYEDTFEDRTKYRQRKEKAVEYLGELIEPQTQGFDHINMDMAFSYLENHHLFTVTNDSMLIVLCRVYGLKISEYLVRGKLATLLNSNKSMDGKTMDMFTTVITKHEGAFEDKTEKKQGFQFPFMGNKNKM